MNRNDHDEHLIETVFRNGTITVVGVVLSFSLGFLTQWASNPVPWKITDLPTLFLISIGIAFQLRSLALLLKTESLKKSVYERASRYFLIGIVITGSGVFVAIVIDSVRLLSERYQWIW
ncbi:hypothetical protein SAMN05428967_3901 [Phyllobacterium sp. YR620]|uniref:hypothetical protein n=1 Tax=unclassified Phyllobacterium TaxID=2638441 RepID=UPI00088A8BC4|nr:MULTISPECIES: hypothetical protein [unclassified Phyllobacterium]SDP85776.1 hypothetical protein SAMN05428967_3901 [Phyllobacterium sp. YR620]SFJ27093.1 hypothetical protein SAMN04515648_3344 [Phyllobacterium sp. CL33Tsu]